MAVIRAGGSTEVEVKEKKRTASTYAMHATKAAVSEACTCFGGGVALLRAMAAIGKLSGDNADIQAGINIVLRALEAPIRQIAENAGRGGLIVVGKVLENKSPTFGFDAQTEQYVDMLSAGIVDPAKVVRVALQGRCIGRWSQGSRPRPWSRRNAQEERGSRQRRAAAWVGWTH